jgi:hypothetical protein
MPLTQAQLDDFAVYARNPETWIGGARGHLAVFEVLADHLDRLRMQSPKPQHEFSGCWFAAYLHAGLAIENAVKASLVGKDPTTIEDGKIDRKKLGGRSGHGFIEMCERLLGSLSEVERRVLFKLEEFVVWAGKYNVPMRADVLYNQDSMNAMRTAPMNERELIRSLVMRLQQHAHAP